MILRFSFGCLILVVMFSVAVSEDNGGSFQAWLESSGDARNTALAGVGVAVADDAWATRYNPAGLGQLTEGIANFTYAQPFAEVDSISLGSLAVAKPLLTGSFTPGTFAFNVSYLYAGGIPEAVEGGTTGRVFSDNDLEVLLGWGKGFGEDYENHIPNNFFVGTAFKIYSEKIGDYRGKSFGMDIGVLNKPVASILSWGLDVRNLVPPGQRMNELGDLAATNLVLGFTLRPVNAIMFSLEGSADSDLLYDSAAGLELRAWDLFAMRGGYRLSSRTPSFGVGFRAGKVGLDYAGIMHPDLGLGHRVTMNLWF